MVEIIKVDLLHDEAYQKLSLDKLLVEAKMFKNTPWFTGIAYISDTICTEYTKEITEIKSTANISDVFANLINSIEKLYELYERIVEYKEFVNITVKKELIKERDFSEMNCIISDIMDCASISLDDKNRNDKISKTMNEAIILINKFKETFTELETAERFLMVSGVLR